jgi:hypothetical protein
MTYQLGNAKVWDGTQWVPAVGGGGGPWYEQLPGQPIQQATVTVTASTAAHTKGAWTELIASTTSVVTALQVIVGGISQSTINTATLLDIGIGASGSEIAIAENIAVGGAVRTATLDLDGISMLLPCDIPSGARISARIQSVVTGGKTASVIVRTQNLGSPTDIEVLGADVVTSQGASLAGASGSWTEIVASTSVSYKAVGIVPSMHSSAIATFAGLYTVGVGSAGSETPLGFIEMFNFAQEGVASVAAGVPPLFTANIPAGSRLSVQHNIAANPDRYGVTLIGVR